MTIYVMLATYTDEGRKMVDENPETVTEIKKKVQEMGATFIRQYSRMGTYDLGGIFEVPDGDSINQLDELLQSVDIMKTVQFMRPYAFSRAEPGCLADTILLVAE